MTSHYCVYDVTVRETVKIIARSTVRDRDHLLNIIKQRKLPKNIYLRYQVKKSNVMVFLSLLTSSVIWRWSVTLTHTFPGFVWPTQALLPILRTHSYASY